MSQPLVQVRSLHRRFGPVRAVDDLSFDIHAGQVVGFIGANGSGKTTTMRMMASLEMPNSGSITIDGLDVVNYPNRVRQKIGWMPDAYGAYDNMSVLEYLDFYARAFGFRWKERQRRMAEVMDFTNLTTIADRPMNKLSKGMAQRLCLGRTLLHDPSVLLLDEPAAGLDPKARVEFKHLVRLLAEEGKTLFISSHILSELEEMCDTMVFIDRGRLIHHGSAESLRDPAAADIIEITVAGSNVALLEWAELQPCVTLVEATKHGARVSIPDTSPEALTGLLQKMIRDGLSVSGFTKKERRLEDAFIDILQNRSS